MQGDQQLTCGALSWTLQQVLPRPACAGNFFGCYNLHMRKAVLDASNHKTVPCGFMAASGYDALREEAAMWDCDTIVYTGTRLRTGQHVLLDVFCSVVLQSKLVLLQGRSSRGRRCVVCVHACKPLMSHLPLGPAGFAGGVRATNTTLQSVRTAPRLSAVQNPEPHASALHALCLLRVAALLQHHSVRVVLSESSAGSCATRSFGSRGLRPQLPPQRVAHPFCRPCSRRQSTRGTATGPPVYSQTDARDPTCRQVC